MQRPHHTQELTGLLRRHRAVAILGARQIGKTTLARRVAARFDGPTTFLDLEDPADLARLAEPLLALQSLSGLVVIDEVQRRPELFPVLRVLLDRPRAPRVLLLGSASPDLLKQSSESLAGRLVFYPLSGFSLDEVSSRQMGKLFLRGGFPRSYLARSLKESAEWRRGFVATFLERDLAQLGVTIPAATLRRFWSMLAHVHADLWTSTAFAQSFGVADTTVRRYLDLLASTFVVRILQPWHANLGKRQVKSPKVYIADTGLLNTMLGLETATAVERHPKLGAAWEGFLMNEVATRLRARPEECFFWRTHAGAELDLLVVRGVTRRGFEFKRTTAPSVTPSMRSALEDLKLQTLDVVHAGKDTFPLSPRIRAVAASKLLDDIEPL